MKKVLIIDDTKNIRELLTTCLEINGYEVICAANGIEGLEILENEKFDLIFLDIKMPKLSGTEVFRRIREQNILTPVIIMTAYATVKNAIECTKLGAVFYIQKPFTADKIKKILIEVNLDETESIESKIMKARNKLSQDPLNKEAYLELANLYKESGNEEKHQKLMSLHNAI